ncbi:hypothetical protein JVU11DRAFT_7079 [Chiua virens]|nr:hypothetical protein JVU11DRAFT_7079 [Chiua virens]
MKYSWSMELGPLRSEKWLAPCSSSELGSGILVPLKHLKLKGLCEITQESGGTDSDEDWKLTTMFNSMKFIADHEESVEESEVEDNDLPFISDDDAQSQLIDLAICLGNNSSDKTWLPP